MTENRKKLSFIPVIAALVFSAAVIIAELIIPLDRLHTASNDEYQNIAMGGKLCTEGSIVYYVSSSGTVRSKGETSEFKIADSGDMLQPYKNGVIYRDENNSIIFSDFTGLKKQTVIENVGDCVLSGNWLFYTEYGENSLKKIRLTDKKQLDLGITVSGDFSVRGNTIIFVGDKSYLYSARTDGSKVSPFLGKTVDSFTFYANYVYFMHEGEVWSVANQNTASMLNHCKADAFTVYNDTMYYISDGEMYSLDLTETEPQAKKFKTKGENPTEIYVSEDYLYYYLADGSLYRCNFSGAGAEKM